jgi:hypothetical protein
MIVSSLLATDLTNTGHDRIVREIEGGDSPVGIDAEADCC